MILRFFISALAVGITAYTLDGVTVSPWWAAIIVALVLGLINTFIRPIVKLLALPLTVLTLGLFTFVINALMVMLCSWLLEQFEVENFWWAMLFSLVVSIVTWILNLFFGKK